MTAENFQQSVNALQKRSPFQPFTIELHGGRRFEIDSAFALVAREGTAVYVAPGGVPILFDHDSVTAIIADIAGASA